jgi:hypothetical protein
VDYNEQHWLELQEARFSMACLQGGKKEGGYEETFSVLNRYPFKTTSLTIEA